MPGASGPKMKNTGTNITLCPRHSSHWRPGGECGAADLEIPPHCALNCLPGMELDDLEKQLSGLDPAAFGLAFQPVKQQALAAASGTTPFSVLFLAFSFFIIAAAAMLVLLLFRLGVEQRAREIGILLALGLNRRQVRRMLLGEGFLIALAGGILGLPLGVGYAALMLLGLRTWWLAAIVTPFLQLHITPLSLIIGFASGILLAMAAIVFSVRGIARVEPRRLLAGQTSRGLSRFLCNKNGDCPDFRVNENGTVPVRLKGVGATVVLSPRISRAETVVILLSAGTVLVLLLGRVREDYQTAAFFGGGTVVLLCLLALVWLRLRAGRTGPAVAVGRGNLLRMALRNAARNAGRSTLTISLVAAASFLIAAVSAFRLDAARQSPRWQAATAVSAWLPKPTSRSIKTSTIPKAAPNWAFPPMMKNNLPECWPLACGSNRATTPVVSTCTGRASRDSWACRRNSSSAAASPGPRCRRNAENPWKLLQLDFGQDPDGMPVVPVILEKNTANYSLNLWRGPGEMFEISDAQGKKIRLQVVALLANSIFQGDLLLDEAALLRYFPQVAGYRFFLFETPPDKTKTVQAILDRTLGDYGFAAETTAQRLAGFMAVQNTYLSTFQSLGGLGLLLGTLGLAAVQLRNVVERRGELALLRQPVSAGAGLPGWCF